MRLYLVRHGEAGTAPTDAERPLTAAGRAAVERLAGWATQHGVTVDEIRHSGLVRARQTAEILAATLAPPHGVSAARGLTPTAPPEPWADELTVETRDVMLVGHMPFLGELASALLARSGHRGSVACDAAGTACLAPAGDTFTLVWYVTPDAG